ncbi:MAG TPA: hypothetical protein VF787_23120 [Thermoanaerobaculia bacterium]
MRKTIAAAFAIAVLLLSVRAHALENEDLLALVAMPLAVAAVSEITDVPMNDLVDVVTLMNDAEVAPPQFLEVVRYVPVALVVEQPSQPRFVDYVRSRTTEGLRGTMLVTSIEDRLRLYDVDVVKLTVDRPRSFDVGDDFIPAIVRTRIVESRSSHPHGGPPGQLKKVAGVQTGAEIVHRDKGTRVAAGDDRGRGKGKDKNKGGHGKGHGKGKG